MMDRKSVAAEPGKNDKRPIARFYRCWLEDVAREIPAQNCRGVNHQQYRAADRLISNYHRVFGNNHRSFVELKSEKNFTKTGKFETQIAAMQQHSKVFSLVGSRSRQILEHFCLNERPLRHYELQQIPQWPKGAGSVRLREALDDLVEAYRRLG